MQLCNDIQFKLKKEEKEDGEEDKNLPLSTTDISNIAIKIKPESKRQEPVTSMVECLLTNLVVKM
jgi:hypothetical protein